MSPAPLKSQNYIKGAYLTPNTENIPHTQHQKLACIPVFVYIMHLKRLKMLKYISGMDYKWNGPWKGNKQLKILQ